MAKGSPLSRGIGTGAAQVFDDSKIYQSFQRKLDKDQAARAAEQEAADLAAAEARGEFEELDLTKGWTLRDSDYLSQEYLNLMDKYNGKWGEVYKDPGLQRELSRDRVIMQQKINKSQAAKEAYGDLSKMYLDEKQNQYFSEEQMDLFNSIAKNPGYVPTGEDLETLSRYKVNLPDSIETAIDGLELSKLVDETAKSYKGADGGGSVKREVGINKDKLREALLARLKSNKVLHDAAQEQFQIDDSDENLNNYIESVYSQVAGRTVSKGYTEGKPTGMEYNEGALNIYSGDPKSVRRVRSFKDINRANPKNWSKGLIPEFENIPVYGTYETTGEQEANVTWSESFKPLNKQAKDDQLTGSNQVRLANPILSPVDANGNVVSDESKADSYQWVVPMTYGADKEGFGSKAVYATVNDFLETNPTYKNSYLGNLNKVYNSKEEIKGGQSGDLSAEDLIKKYGGQ